MSLNHYKYFCMSIVSLLVTINGAIAVNAEDNVNSQKLNVLDSNTIYLSKNNQSREYIFKSPDNKTLTNTRSLTAAQGYKVEVYGNGQELLLQVRDIEPKAFIKGNIIQVGIFSQQNNAEDMVRKLAVAGFWARIVPQ